MISRRKLLHAACAATAPGFASLAAAQPPVRRLVAAPARAALAGAEHPSTDVWAYGGTVPGPELRLRQSERLQVEVENRLGVETTVHWHGIRLPNAMDGVPHLTQPPIAAHGGRFSYTFDLPDAGTYWYHPHLASTEQVGRGLYGALVVEERVPPAVDRDLVWVLSDWRLDAQARIVPDFMAPHDASHAGRIGNIVTVNGAVLESFGVRAGERIRLRLVNASSARICALAFEGHAPQLIAFDGQPVQPRPAARVLLGPAQRADVILDCSGRPGTRHRVVDHFYPRQAYRLLDLAYADQPPLRAEFPPVPRLPPNPVPVADLAAAVQHRIVVGGGAMGTLPAGSPRGPHGPLFWTVNGRAVADDGHTHAPLLNLQRGRSCVLELVNDTAWHHPIHLHGHVFRVVSRNARPPEAEESGDTVLIEPRGRAQVAFVADNPGDWMLHCHVLQHQASGMMATVRVA